jgi:hypothetical protein
LLMLLWSWSLHLLVKWRSVQCRYFLKAGYPVIFIHRRWVLRTRQFLFSIVGLELN